MSPALSVNSVLKFELFFSEQIFEVINGIKDNHNKLYKNFWNLENAAFPKTVALDYNDQKSYFDTSIK